MLLLVKVGEIFSLVFSNHNQFIWKINTDQTLFQVHKPNIIPGQTNHYIFFFQLRKLFKNIGAVNDYKNNELIIYNDGL